MPIGAVEVALGTAPLPPGPLGFTGSLPLLTALCSGLLTVTMGPDSLRSRNSYQLYGKPSMSSQ